MNRNGLEATNLTHHLHTDEPAKTHLSMRFQWLEDRHESVGFRIQSACNAHKMAIYTTHRLNANFDAILQHAMPKMPVYPAFPRLLKFE